jgi:hypothetical protein
LAGLEEQQSSFFRLSLAEPVWDLSGTAFSWGRQDFSSSLQGVAGVPSSMLITGWVGVHMATGRALGGAQQAEPQAMVRDNEAQETQVKRKCFQCC